MCRVPGLLGLFACAGNFTEFLCAYGGGVHDGRGDGRLPVSHPAQRVDAQVAAGESGKDEEEHVIATPRRAFRLLIPLMPCAKLGLKSTFGEPKALQTNLEETCVTSLRWSPRRVGF